MNKSILLLAFGLILFAGWSLRAPWLADRPMHHDEANQAYRFGGLLEDGEYVYDADDHHGPTLYYLTLPIAWATGAKTFAETNEITYRALPVIFGLLLIICLPIIRSGLGPDATVWAMLFTAISPGMAYYSRFYIQEMSLVFFTFLMIATGYRCVKTGARRWAIFCGISAGFMFATKETAIIAYAAMVGAALPLALKNKTVGVSSRNLAWFALSGAAVAFVWYSSFFTNMSGPLDSILAFKGYFARGVGENTDHVHPWYFYLRILTFHREGGLLWSEGLVMALGLYGCFATIRGKLPRNRDAGLAWFIMLYTGLLTAAYSVLAYKTPWCALSFLHGWILLAGLGVAALFAGCARLFTLRWAVIGCRTLLILLLIPPAVATWKCANNTVFRFAADDRNPYVYAHTSMDFMNLARRVDDLAAASPRGDDLYIQVIAKPDATWPLPFYLRAYTNVGFWTDAEEVPGAVKPDLVISAPNFETDSDAFLTEYYGLRSDTLLAIHIDRALWDAFLATRAMPRPGKK